jgi:hypothetical protein
LPTSGAPSGAFFFFEELMVCDRAVHAPSLLDVLERVGINREVAACWGGIVGYKSLELCFTAA